MLSRVGRVDHVTSFITSKRHSPIYAFFLDSSTIRNQTQFYNVRIPYTSVRFRILKKLLASSDKQTNKQTNKKTKNKQTNKKTHKKQANKQTSKQTNVFLFSGPDPL